MQNKTWISKQNQLIISKHCKKLGFRLEKYNNTYIVCKKLFVFIKNIFNLVDFKVMPVSSRGQIGSKTLFFYTY